MTEGKARTGAVYRSICGVTPAHSRLQVPKTMCPTDVKIVCAELCSNVFSEAIGVAAQGDEGQKITVLNRRSTAFAKDWRPLQWAAKDGNEPILCELLDNNAYGIDINEKEDGKSNAAFCALLWATAKNHPRVIELLAERGADMYATDKHGNTARDLAMKKHEAGIIKILDRVAPKTEQPNIEKKEKAKPMPGWA